MNVIFLDIDGVLNYKDCKAKCSNYLGISNKKVKILKKIVEKSNAKIVLSSTWRYDWEKNKETQNEFGNYLDRKLKKENLFVFDKTRSLENISRGGEIKEWLQSHEDIENWIVLDDEIFSDFKQEGIIEHLVKTEFDKQDGGLQETDINIALKLLEGEQ
jgi:glutamyl/glutaminyl-tRNA synthetase